MTYTKILSTKTLRESVNTVKYAVRGSIPTRGDAINVELQNGVKHPFKKIVNCNIGNPQQLQQPPISFIRQVISLVEYPDLLEDSKLPLTLQLYPRDAIARAKSILETLGSVGAYTHSQGISIIRKHVAEFIEKRDGYPADPDSIFLTTGASPGVQLILSSIIQHPKVGVMIPIPQYPLYTASICLFNGTAVKYYLDEEMKWGLSVKELTESLNKARAEGIDVRVCCIINPGNPTGQCLSEKNMVEIIDFCHKNNLIILADEVYQSNAYHPDLPFHSFKKVLKSMGEKYAMQELISFHSISKGMIGECGRRGGFYECVGIDPEVMKCFYKVASISLCPPVSGQIAVDLMVKPPQKGDESYDKHNSEINAIYQSLVRRSKKLSAAFNSLPGVSCNDAQGAMYLFPQITLSAKAIEAAKLANLQPDEFYCMNLLEETGVCVVPGSGFLQKSGTWHFRCTFLPKEEDIDGFIASFKGFHLGFVEKYN